jgi:hypothetical protein
MFYLSGRHLKTAGIFNLEEAKWQDPAPEIVDAEGKRKMVTDKCTVPKKMEIYRAHYDWGHMGEVLTEKMAKDYDIELYGTLTPCEGCGTAKAKQKAVSKTTNVKETRRGERIFLDASGLYHETLWGNKYWFKAVDDYGQFGWKHFAPYKSKMVDFAESIIIQLKGKGLPVKYLCCDNAGENVKPLKTLCDAHGITIKFTAPDMPQQNGVVERCIVVLTQCANTMMMAANLNKEGRKVLWAKAVNTANILENIISTSVNPKSAYKMVTKKKLNLIPYLHPFGRLRQTCFFPFTWGHFVSFAETSLGRSNVGETLQGYCTPQTGK